MSHTVSKACRNFIEGWEGRRREAYVCSAGHWTIGVGHVLTLHELSVYKAPLTDDEIEALFTLDLWRFEEGVNDLIGDYPTSQAQFDAMLAFAFNVGLDIDSDDVAEGLGDSTLLRRHLQGKTLDAAEEFLKWNKAWSAVAGKLVPVEGLTKRRQAERAIYLWGDYSGRP